jgi:hypothetical protein
MIPPLEAPMKPILLLALFALFLGGCSSSGGDSDVSDTSALDLGSVDAAPEVASDATVDTLPDLGLDTVAPACVAPGMVGTILDPAGAPIPGVRLFLCGETEDGQASCITRSTDATGAFLFSDLPAGFSHVKINSVVAGQQLGRLFGGVTMAIDPYPLPNCLDLGALTLPEFFSPPAPTAADAAVTLAADWLQVEVPAGGLAFPDYADEAVVMLAAIPPAQSPIQPADQFFAFALIPQGAAVAGGATVRVKVGQFATAPRLVTNSAETGQVLELPAPVADEAPWAWKWEASLPELTWVWIIPQ